MGSEKQFCQRLEWPLVLAMFLPAIGAWGYFVAAGNHPAARIAYAAVKVFTLLWPVLVFRFVLEQPLRFRLPGGMPLKRSLIEGAVLGLGLGGFIFVSLWTPLGEVVRGGSDAVSAKVDDMGIRSFYWTFALALSIGHSLIEEYYWRGFVFGRLRLCIPRVPAHILAGIAFSLHHIVICSHYFSLFWGVVLGAFVGLGGMIWSLLYVRHGHFWGAWLSHIIVDLVLVSIGYQLISP